MILEEVYSLTPVPLLSMLLSPSVEYLIQYQILILTLEVQTEVAIVLEELHGLTIQAILSAMFFGESRLLYK